MTLYRQREKRVSKITYDLRNPITDAFEPIQELEQLAIAGNRLYAQSQLVDFSVAVISNTHDFESALIVWHSLPPLLQTWNQFNTDFTIPRKYLCKVCGNPYGQQDYISPT